MTRLHSIELATRRWRQLLANRGMLATMQAVVAGAHRRLLPGPGREEVASDLWRNSDAVPVDRHPFDVEFGTDTSGLIWGEELPTGHRHDAWNTAYYGIAPSAFAEALRLLSESCHLDWSQFTFIDLGSGKGRAVLLASQYPFAAVLGVELAPQLHRVAMANLASFPAMRRKAARVTMVLGDAAAFPWQHALPGALVFFLYNPFSRPVLERFLEKLKASWNRMPRTVYLLYINPELDAVIVRKKWIEKLWQKTIVIGEIDRLADRFGSTTENVAAYRCEYPSNRAGDGQAVASQRI